MKRRKQLGIVLLVCLVLWAAALWFVRPVPLTQVVTVAPVAGERVQFTLEDPVQLEQEGEFTYGAEDRAGEELARLLEDVTCCRDILDPFPTRVLTYHTGVEDKSVLPLDVRVYRVCDPASGREKALFADERVYVRSEDGAWRSYLLSRPVQEDLIEYVRSRLTAEKP